jgi:hypothetical protein
MGLVIPSPLFEQLFNEREFLALINLRKKIPSGIAGQSG